MKKDQSPASHLPIYSCLYRHHEQMEVSCRTANCQSGSQAGQGDIDVRSRQILTDRPACVDTIGRSLANKKKNAGQEQQCCMFRVRPYPPSSNQRLFGRQRPRSAFNSSLALCKIIEPREAKKQRAMYGASLAVNQRAVTRFCPQQVRRQEKRQAAVISSIQDCTSDLCADNCNRYFAPQKLFVQIICFLSRIGRRMTLDVRRPLAKFKRAQRS